MEILYEDNHLIAVVKQPGQLMQGDVTGDACLLDDVKAFIKERDHKPGNVFLGLLHRLDRPVGGVVLLAKTSKGASRLSAQIRERQVTKHYQALVEGTPPAEGRVAHWLLKDRVHNRVRVVDGEQVGAKWAELTYRRLSSGPIARVELIPTTGRPHQIRVAMVSIGTPIVGDLKYGAKQPWNGNIALWATELAFNHPISGERIVVHSLPPWPQLLD